MDISLLLIILIFLLDIAVLYSIVRTKSTQGSRILYVLIVLLLPVIGISIYYLIRE